ncbi:hypothetical protein LguiB_028074 [Lonicera macranthoides]
MTYLENQIPEPPPHLEEIWTRTLDLRDSLDSLFWAWTDRGVKLRHYTGDVIRELL